MGFRRGGPQAPGQAGTGMGEVSTHGESVEAVTGAACGFPAAEGSAGCLQKAA
ncbi:hypothetical protein GCM10009823_18810 [Brevibacterium salitolerans]|uniref:Uncharacterized protein n=1 Tax=Brevibacterium salitolerans TaxID=1403566 RepID=A0ABP5IG37_9MICO